MIFILFSLCLLRHRATSQHLNDAVKSALEYYGSRSVVLMFDESTSDSFTFISAQKQLSSGKDFYLSSATTLSSFPESVRLTRQSLRETVMVWNPSDNFPLLLKEVSDETDITSAKWFLMTSTLLPQAFVNVTIPLKTEFAIAYGDGQPGYALAEIYDVRPGKRLTNALSRWSAELQPSTDLFKRRRDFSGTAIRVMSPKKDPCDGMSFAVTVATIVWCIHQKLWNVMAEILNATTEIQVVPNLALDSIPGGNTDLSFRSAPVNVVDMNTRDFVWPTFMVKMEVVTRYIKQDVEWKTYILPFRKHMWMVVLVWIILWDVLLASVQFLVFGKETKKSFLRSCCEFCFTTVFTFSSQSILCPSKLLGVRIMFLMMFIVPAVLFPGYSAVLTSFLTVHQDKQPFQSLEEMSRTDEYKLGWHNTLTPEHFFNLKNTTPSEEALLRNNIVPQEELPSTDKEAIKRMCSEKFSYITIRATLLAVKPECKFYAFKQPFMMHFTSIELKKNSWYKYFLDRCERNIAFSGLKNRIDIQVAMKFIKLGSSKVVEKIEVSPIQLNNTVLPFAVLLFGIVSSVVLLLLEVVCFRLNSRQPHASTVPLQHKPYDFVL